MKKYDKSAPLADGLGRIHIGAEFDISANVWYNCRKTGGEPMFEIQTKYTFEEYKRYVYDTDIARRKFAPDIYKQRFSILRTLAETYMLGSVAFLIWGAFRFEDLWFAAMSGFFGSIVMITLIFRFIGRHSTKKKMNRTTEYELRRVWESDSLTRDSVVTYVFGEDGFDVKLPHGI